MVNRAFANTSVTPLCPFAKARLELQILDEYGRRNERTFSKIYKAARELMTLKEEERSFRSTVLLDRLVRIASLFKADTELEHYLSLKVEYILERLQTKVLKLDLAITIHKYRVIIRKQYIRFHKRAMNILSIIKRLVFLMSPYSGGRICRVKRKNLKKRTASCAAAEDEVA